MSAAVAPMNSSVRFNPLQGAEYTATSLILTFFKDKGKDIAKIFAYSSFWYNQSLPENNPAVQNFSFFMGDVKNVYSTIEIPEKASELWESLLGLWTVLTQWVDGVADLTWQATSKAAIKILKNGSGLATNLCDGLDISSKLVTIDKGMMTWIKGINFSCVLIGTTIDGAEQASNLVGMYQQDNWSNAKAALYMINIARNASYFVLGYIGLTCIATGTPIVAWQMVACLTSGLLWTIGGYFYERIADPEGKGKNLNPAVIAQNALANRVTVAA